MSIGTLDITEGWADLEPLSTALLHAAFLDAEDFINTNIVLNLYQLKRDIFGDDVDYDFNNDGNAINATPLVDTLATLSDDETVSGAWTFTGQTAFSAAVSSTSTFSSSGQPRCKVYRSTSNQTVTTAVVTAVSFQSEVYDTGAMHDTGLNVSRITIPTGGSGTYLFSAQIVFDNNNTGRREIYLYKNGAEATRTQLFNPDATQDSYMSLNYQDVASAGDYYEVYVYQNSGGNLDIIFGADVTSFSAMKVW